MPQSQNNPLRNNFPESFARKLRCNNHIFLTIKCYGMRCFHLYFLMVLSTGITTLAGCGKDTPAVQFSSGSSTPSNTPPKAYAGRDIWVMLPASTATLSVGASDKEGNLDKWLWRQVAGPRPSMLENQGTYPTKVSDLVKGSYEFELTVTDKGGLSGKDTVALFVREPAPSGHGEVVFNNLGLDCPMGCHLWIDCIYCRVPVNQPLRVYLREAHSTFWIEAVPENQWTINHKYSYRIDNGNFMVYTNDESNTTADVKITY